jgi:hypothetical protein
MRNVASMTSIVFVQSSGMLRFREIDSGPIVNDPVKHLSAKMPV